MTVCHNKRSDEQKSKLFQLRFLCFCFFILGNLSALFELLFAALSAARLARSAGDDIDNDAAIIFSTLGARVMRPAKRAALAFCTLDSGKRMVTPTLRGLGTISAHSYYHSCRIIQILGHCATERRARAY